MASVVSKGWALALAIGIGAAVAGAAIAQDDKMPPNASPATKAAYARHENYRKLGGAFKALNDELKKGEPDKTVVAANAKTISTLAGQLPTWFPRGSGVEARPLSEAKADIWRDAAGFSTAASNLQAQATKLNQLAAAGDIDGVKGQVRNTGMACKSCHDKYRLEKKKD
jgi:cytochrome c556